MATLYMSFFEAVPLIFGGAFALMLVCGCTGMLIELDGRYGGTLRLGEIPSVVAGLVLTVLLTLFYTFKTPLGPAVLSAVAEGDGASLVIFGGPVPVPIAGVVFCFVPIVLVGAATAVALLCLADMVITFVKNKIRR